mmetsp:Transcript_16155/g.27575  ORF Transcript_16155/g.27575 Transcript_16155/m.27575 type:complete len:269 (-) Transcript_16155:220-1026(-)
MERASRQLESSIVHVTCNVESKERGAPHSRGADTLGARHGVARVGARKMTGRRRYPATRQHPDFDSGSGREHRTLRDQKPRSRRENGAIDRSVRSGQVVDGEGLHLVSDSRAHEAEDLRVKVELRVEGVLDVLRLAEAVLLSRVHLERAGQPLGKQLLVHQLRLIGRHNLVLVALQQQHGARQLVCGVDGRPLVVERLLLRIPAHEPVQVPRLELVCVGGERAKVSDTVEGAACREDVAPHQRAEGRETASRATVDCETLWVRELLLH